MEGPLHPTLRVVPDVDGDGPALDAQLHSADGLGDPLHAGEVDHHAAVDRDAGQVFDRPRGQLVTAQPVYVAGPVLAPVGNVEREVARDRDLRGLAVGLVDVDQHDGVGPARRVWLAWSAVETQQQEVHRAAGRGAGQRVGFAAQQYL